MLNPLNFFTKPEFFFQPNQVFRRLQRFRHPRQPLETIRLPWGAEVKVHTEENIGSEIYYYGVFDKVVPEAIFRLLDLGESAVEVGANIGQNCSLMAYKTGANGNVLAFEPHPEIFEELKRNALYWPEKNRAKICLENVALGEKQAEAWLKDGDDFQSNRGSATIEQENVGGKGFKITVHPLDDYIEEGKTVGVCKIDVEGHELSVLKGASRLLRQKAIRDIVFEDFNPQPSDVIRLLLEHGYEIFCLKSNWLKPMLMPLEFASAKPSGFSYNFLATLQASRAQKRFQLLGWRCLLNF